MNTEKAMTSSPRDQDKARQMRPGPHPTEDIYNYLCDYAKEKPQAMALWCFGIGFVLGWKLKPW